MMRPRDSRTHAFGLPGATLLGATGNRTQTLTLEPISDAECYAKILSQRNQRVPWSRYRGGVIGCGTPSADIA